MGVFGAIGGALIQSRASSKAAKSQEAAANRDIAYQQETRDLIRADLAPFREGGTTANQAQLNMLGLASGPMVNGQEWNWQTDPGYAFRMNEGVKAIDAGAAARGGLYSGSAMKALNKFGQDYASQEFGNTFARLGAMSGQGLAAAQMSGNAAQNTAAGVSNALAGIGNAQAAGAIGRGNAINTGIGNALGAWQYQKQMGGMNGNGSWANPLFGGPGLGGFV